MKGHSKVFVLSCVIEILDIDMERAFLSPQIGGLIGARKRLFRWPQSDKT